MRAREFNYNDTDFVEENYVEDTNNVFYMRNSIFGNSLSNYEEALKDSYNEFKESLIF